jgi:hypothetical protein
MAQIRVMQDDPVLLDHPIDDHARYLRVEIGGLAIDLASFLECGQRAADDVDDGSLVEA